MKRLVVVMFTLIMFVGCASTQLGKTATEACSLYQDVRPDVVEFKLYAGKNWASIPPDQQKILLDLNAYLPELDEAGKAVCAFALGRDVEITWKQVLFVLQGVGTAVRLYTGGVP